MSKITKIDSTKRHINSAIRLHFQEFDPIIVHTLGSTAFRVLRDLSEKRGDISKNIYENISDYTRKKIFNIFNQDINFFKHADKDPDGVLEDFNPLVNDNLLGICCLHFGDLGYNLTNEMKAFMHWYPLIDPNCPEIYPNQKQLKEKLKLYKQKRRKQLSIGAELIQKFKHSW